MRPAWNDQSEPFFERPDVILVIVWAMFLVPTVAVVVMFWLSDRRAKQERAERRRRGEKVREITFFSTPEEGELSPGTKLILHVMALSAVIFFLHWLPTLMSKQFARLDPALASHVTLQSLITLVSHVIDLGGNLIMWHIILCIMRIILWEETPEAYRVYKKCREERHKKPPPPSRSFVLYRPSRER